MHVVCSNCHTKNRVPAVAWGVPHCGKCHSPLPWVVDATDTDFEAVAEKSTIPVLVDVWAPWCQPCRMVSPALERLANERAGRLKLVKVNADVSPYVSQRFDVQAIPTLILLNRGQVMGTQVGCRPGTRTSLVAGQRTRPYGGLTDASMAASAPAMASPALSLPAQR